MGRFLVASYVLLATLVAAAPTKPGVMNAGGVPYGISNPPGSTQGWHGTPGTYSTNFNDNVKGPVDHFDVYGEVQTKYSQVYWTRNAPINLPKALVERFAGKVMAITGYEVDQVTHSGPQPGSTTTSEMLGGFSCYPDCSETDRSIPEYNAYNHHYFSWLTGKDAELYDRTEAGFPPQRIPNPTTTGFSTKEGVSHKYPTNIVFKENPGGEFRKSYHGYPSQFAQLLHSPSQWVVEPMQIDTHNRAYDINEPVGFHPSFLPKIQRNNMTQHGGGLSPLIECPCPDRITRSTVETSQVMVSETCASTISSEDECTQAVASMAPVASSVTIDDISQPSGCVMIPQSTGSYKAVFNVAMSEASCGSDSGAFDWVGPVNGTSIDCASGRHCLKSDAKYGCTGEFDGQCTWDTVQSAQENCGKYGECKGFYCSSRFSKKSLCFGRTTDVTKTSPVKQDQTWHKAFASARTLVGQQQGEVNMTVAHNGEQATVTVSGPDGVWFAVGFDANKMADLPYAIVVDGAGGVTERKLGSHAPGAVLTPSVTVESSSVLKGIRSVVLSRAVRGASKDHYSLPTSPGDISLITAVGSTPTLAYHKARTSSKIVLLPTETASCVCSPTVKSYMTYMNQSTSEFEGYSCADEPRGDMLKHGDGTGRSLPNAACEMKTYNGGLKCCAHHNFLTDLEQDSLIPNETDTYFLKWRLLIPPHGLLLKSCVDIRYYFQEYEPAAAAAPASHKHLHHWVFLIDQAVNDYEEDNAHYGTASVGKITAHLTGAQMGLEDTPKEWKNWSPFVMTPHCHAPSCIREELWNADTGEILCNMTAHYGNAKYGPLSEIFNEQDYVAILPCLYSNNQEGLQTPFVLTADTNITAIKYFNNTYRHLGQMAQWTGMMTYDTDPF